jgi:hypothetical protein
MLILARMCTEMEKTHLAKGTLPDHAVEIKVVEADLSVKVYWLGEAAPHVEKEDKKVARGLYTGTVGKNKTIRLGPGLCSCLIYRNCPRYSSAFGMNPI